GFGGNARIAPPLLFGRLFRLAGADATIFPNYGGRFAYGREECAAIAERARERWGGLRPAFPVAAGGMALERVEEIVAFYGRDVMLLLGGTLLLGKEGVLERTRAFTAKVRG
ncbi:MAG: ribulose 1,5-bisphosphate carboxylase, partial [Candidatus Eremiobacteraeota bacterium]|nr:ribulose 1,5-bisphosphate carboxylase [Candidatus Eremiobacteraeota bacterium]